MAKRKSRSPKSQDERKATSRRTEPIKPSSEESSDITGAREDTSGARERMGGARLVGVGIVSLVLLSIVWGFWVSRETLAKVDEPYHFAQIMMFMQGDWAMLRVDGMKYPFFAMLPGYHAVVAIVFDALGSTDPVLMRGFSGICGVAIFLIALMTSRRLDNRYDFVRAAQVFFSPFAFPFYFLLYSDIFSLLTVLALLHAMIARQKLAACVASVGCLLVRQSHIVLLGLLASLEVKNAFSQSDKDLVSRAFDSAKVILPLVPALLLFLLFFIWNGRVPLCTPQLQQTSTLGWNVLLFLSLASIWLAPVQIAIAKDSFRFVLENRIATIGVMLAAVMLLSRLWIEDPRNRYLGELLRNDVMHYAIESIVGYSLFFVTIVWALISLLASKWNHPYGSLTLAVIVLSMGPIMLVEPRYFIPATSWYLLFRRSQSIVVESIQLAWMCILAIGLHWLQSSSPYLM